MCDHQCFLKYPKNESPGDPLLELNVFRAHGTEAQSCTCGRCRYECVTFLRFPVGPKELLVLNWPHIMKPMFTKSDWR